MTYEVDVTVSTHEALKEGVLALAYLPGGQTWHRIYIDPDAVANDREAVLLAAQMACCNRRAAMCTRAELVSWPTYKEER
jgi:hypothetical protein